MRYTTTFVSAIAGLLLASCSQEAPPTRIETPALIGVVDNVYPGHGYALVRLNGPPPSEGTVLISQSPGNETQPRIANLIVSAEKLGNLRVPADIRSGSVMKGDLVFVYKNLAPPSPQQQDPIAAADEDDPPEKETHLADVTPPAPAPAPVKPAATPSIQTPEIPQPGQPLAPSIKEILDNTPETYDETTR